MRYALAFAILLSLAGCDSDNAHWKAVSNPSGTPPHPQGGTVIVVVQSRVLASEPTPDPLFQDRGSNSSPGDWAEEQNPDDQSSEGPWDAADRGDPNRVEVYVLSGLEGIVSDSRAVQGESGRITNSQGETIVAFHDRHLLRLEPIR